MIIMNNYLSILQVETGEPVFCTNQCGSILDFLGEIFLIWEDGAEYNCGEGLLHDIHNFCNNAIESQNPIKDLDKDLCVLSDEKSSMEGIVKTKEFLDEFLKADEDFGFYSVLINFDG